VEAATEPGALSADVPLAPATDEIFQVERLLNVREVRGKRQFLVRWRGYSEKHDSWSDETDILDPSLIERFWAAARQQQQQVAPTERSPRRPPPCSDRAAEDAEWDGA